MRPSESANKVPTFGPVFRSNGFTLIELLVVIAIIAILMVAIYPAVSNSIVKAKGIKSASNLRAIGVGIHGYLADKNNAFPMMSGPKWAVPERWYEVIKPYLGVRTNYYSDVGIYKNPFIKVDPKGNCQYGSSSFIILYNSVNPDDPSAPPSWYWGPGTPVRLFQIPKPSQTVMVLATSSMPQSPPESGIFNMNASGFVDGGSRTGYGMPLPDPDGAVPLLFVDGHTERMAWNELHDRRKELFGVKPFNAQW